MQSGGQMGAFGEKALGAEHDPIVLILHVPTVSDAADSHDWMSNARDLADAGRRVILCDVTAIPDLGTYLAAMPSRPVVISDAAPLEELAALSLASSGGLFCGLITVGADETVLKSLNLSIPVLALSQQEDAEAHIAEMVDYLERYAPREPIHYEAGSDARTLRDALGCFTTGVTIVTTTDVDGAPVGLTANSFTSVSLDPPLVLFCLAKSSSNLEPFSAAEHFAVNVLHMGQQPASSVFARPNPDRFSAVQWETWETGAPIISGSMASFECVRHQVIDAGDHMVFIGRVTRAQYEPHRDPLLYFRGKYRRLHLA